MTTKQAVRDRLQSQAQWPLPSTGWGQGDGWSDHDVAERTLLPAAVLVALIGYPGGPSIVLTRRTPHLRDHGGQISFPGGRIEPSDASPEAAALREAAEETGLPVSRVEILGRLRPYDTITGFHVHPIVGWVEPPISYTPDPFEVSEVFEVPLAFVLDAANHRQAEFEREGRSGLYYFLDYGDRHIWGATAGMLVELSRVLNR